MQANVHFIVVGMALDHHQLRGIVATQSTILVVHNLMGNQDDEVMAWRVSSCHDVNDEGDVCERRESHK